MSKNNKLNDTPSNRYNKGKAFSFTWNNYPSNYRDIFNGYSDKIKYLVIGEEISKTGTPHLQGFIRWKTGTTDLSTSKKFGKCHVELSRGNDKENDDYCRGLGETSKRHGKTPTEPEKIFTIGDIGICGTGRRTDLIELKESTKQGIPLRKLIDEQINGYTDLKFVENIIKYNEKPRVYDKDFKFYWIYGPTALGKTKYVIEKMYKTEYEQGNLYIAMNNSKWWDGYDAHKIVLIDDFRDTFCSFSNLLQICQPVEYRIENKGGTRQLLAKTIIITSCHSPLEVYEDVSENKTQLYRRITALLRFYDNDKYEDETLSMRELIDYMIIQDKNQNRSLKEVIADNYPNFKDYKRKQRMKIKINN